MAPAATAVWMDAAVGAASFSAESWLEAAGAVAAENQALEFLGGLAGLPVGSGGAFCSGGSVGNLSALAVARDASPPGAVCVVADTAHSSVRRANHLVGVTTEVVATPEDGRLTGDLLDRYLRQRSDPRSVGIVVASAGSTNGGVVDDLAGVARVAHQAGAWFHVDAAYGGAALVLADHRQRFGGIELADSLIVDPHKWLFSTAGSCAVLYREPERARACLRQSGPYIDVLHETEPDEQWNPSDYAFQLTRRASGLPFWFTLVAHGTDALADDVRVAIDLARYAADEIARLDVASLVIEPSLGVVLFRRAGWDAARWRQWARDLADDGVAFVAPTTWKGEVVGRLVFLNPRTTTAIVDEVVATLREA
jgi:glutamate/tyrosine decarboxylase-like PLP-dependent enzyme